jgi:hypothetical protein
MDPALGLPVFEYAMELLPPGRLGPRRWRWELWEGDRLLAAGWHPAARRAHVALRTAASRRAHERVGLTPLRPERAVAALGPAAPRLAATYELDCGAVACLLRPRGAAALAAAA